MLFPLIKATAIAQIFDQLSDVFNDTEYKSEYIKLKNEINEPEKSSNIPKSQDGINHGSQIKELKNQDLGVDDGSKQKGKEQGVNGKNRSFDSTNNEEIGKKFLDTEADGGVRTKEEKGTLISDNQNSKKMPENEVSNTNKSNLIDTTGDESLANSFLNLESGNDELLENVASEIQKIKVQKPSVTDTISSFSPFNLFSVKSSRTSTNGIKTVSAKDLEPRLYIPPDDVALSIYNNGIVSDGLLDGLCANCSDDCEQNCPPACICNNGEYTAQTPVQCCQKGIGTPFNKPSPILNTVPNRLLQGTIQNTPLPTMITPSFISRTINPTIMSKKVTRPVRPSIAKVPVKTLPNFITSTYSSFITNTVFKCITSTMNVYNRIPVQTLTTISYLTSTYSQLITQAIYSTITQPVYHTVSYPIYSTITQPVYHTVSYPIYSTITKPIYSAITQPVYHTISYPIYSTITQPITYTSTTTLPINHTYTFTKPINHVETCTVPEYRTQTLTVPSNDSNEIKALLYDMENKLKPMAALDAQNFEIKRLNDKLHSVYEIIRNGSVIKNRVTACNSSQCMYKARTVVESKPCGSKMCSSVCVIPKCTMLGSTRTIMAKTCYGSKCKDENNTATSTCAEQTKTCKNQENSCSVCRSTRDNCSSGESNTCTKHDNTGSKCKSSKSHSELDSSMTLTREDDFCTECKSHKTFKESDQNTKHCSKCKDVESSSRTKEISEKCNKDNKTRCTDDHHNNQSPSCPDESKATQTDFDNKNHPSNCKGIKHHSSIISCESDVATDSETNHGCTCADNDYKKMDSSIIGKTDLGSNCANSKTVKTHCAESTNCSKKCQDDYGNQEKCKRHCKTETFESHKSNSHSTKSKLCTESNNTSCVISKSIKFPCTDRDFIVDCKTTETPQIKTPGDKVTECSNIDQSKTCEANFTDTNKNKKTTTYYHTSTKIETHLCTCLHPVTECRSESQLDKCKCNLSESETHIDKSTCKCNHSTKSKTKTKTCTVIEEEPDLPEVGEALAEDDNDVRYVLLSDILSEIND